MAECVPYAVGPLLTHSLTQNYMHNNVHRDAKLKTNLIR